MAETLLVLPLSTTVGAAAVASATVGAMASADPDSGGSAFAQASLDYLALIVADGPARSGFVQLSLSGGGVDGSLFLEFGSFAALCGTDVPCGLAETFFPITLGVPIGIEIRGAGATGGGGFWISRGEHHVSILRSRPDYSSRLV